MSGRRAASAQGFSPRAWIKRAARRVPTSAAGGILLGVFLAATAAFGGLATAAPSTPAPVVIGEAASSYPWSLKVHEVFSTDAVSGTGLLDAEAGPYLVARVTAENVWDSTLGAGGSPGDLASAVTLSGVQTAAGSMVDVIRVDDGSPVADLQPGVPVEAYIVWRLPAGSPVPASATLQLKASELKTLSMVATGEYWDTASVVASSALAVASRPGPLADNGSQQ